MLAGSRLLQALRDLVALAEQGNISIEAVQGCLRLSGFTAVEVMCGNSCLKMLPDKTMVTSPLLELN